MTRPMSIAGILLTKKIKLNRLFQLTSNSCCSKWSLAVIRLIVDRGTMLKCIVPVVYVLCC